jgi:drug/metabolite transporter (DMT)-like permease
MLEERMSGSPGRRKASCVADSTTSGPSVQGREREPASLPELCLVALAAAAFATASPLAKLAHGVPFAVLAAARCAIAAFGLLLVRPTETLRAVAALSPRQRASLVSAGLLLAAHFAFFLGGLLATSLAAAAALVSLEPIAVVLAAWVAFRERPTGREQVGLAIAVAGALVVASGAGTGQHSLKGDALVLAGVAFFGAYVAMARGLRETLPMAPYAASVYSVAAIALAPLAVALPPTAPVPAASIAVVVAMGLVPTLVGHTLMQRAARVVPASIAALACPGETVGATLLGACIGHAPSTAEWAGAAFVVLGATVAVTGA